MRWLLAPFLALCCLPGPGVVWAAVAPIPTPEIWFVPPQVRDGNLVFQDDAPWREAARKVSMIVLVAEVVRRTPVADVAVIGAFARQHGIKLGVVLQSIAKYQNQSCGGIEGYSYPGEMKEAVDVLHRAGVSIDTVVMDEPVWFGHYDPQPGGCRVALPELVDRVALVVQEALDFYPHARLVEIEPIPDLTDNPGWRQTLTAFRLGMARKLGRRITDIQLDVNWNNPGWKQSMRDIRAHVRQQNMGLGIFYNGTDQDTSDAAWFARAIRNFETVEGALGLVPTQALFTSWHPFGVLNLPETTPYTQTWLINRYVREPARLSAGFEGMGAHGILTTARGRPIANATVRGFVPGVDFSQPLPESVVEGVVPATAATAIIAFRLNTECRCDGPNDVLIGTLTYAETSGGSGLKTFAFPSVSATYGKVIVDGETVGGTRVTRVVAEPGQSFTPNSDIFPVTAGARYRFTVPAATVGGMGWYGNAIIIWIDQSGNGIGRVFVTPEAGRVLTSTAVTGADGKFILPRLPRTGSASAPVTVEFEGNGTYHPVVWSPSP